MTSNSCAQGDSLIREEELLQPVLGLLIHPSTWQGAVAGQGAGCGDLVLCRSECAILYNDRSVLENHHISSVFRMMQDDEMNIFINLTKDEFV